jgi:subtilisin family serine protease
MRKLVLAGLASVAAVVACSDVPAPVAPRPTPTSAPSTSRGAAIEGRYIVLFRSGTDVDRESSRIAAATGGKVTHRYHAAVRGMAIQLPAAAAAALANVPSVALVEQDQVMTASTIQTGATWGLDRIDQRNLPLSTSYTYNSTGAGVTAYIIDTGILFSHSEFGGRATTGVDEITPGGNAADCNGHGTHVSGTVGGSTYGVAKGVNLVAVRVLDCGGSGPNTGVIAGVDWVTAQHQADPTKPAVANMSLGGGASSALDQAIANSVASGVTYGVAAGNGNILGIAQNACNYSPSREPSAITVSATDKTDTKASWANYGTCVDIFAPGVGITSSWFDGGTNTISGTSMATPHVVGAAALYLQANPAATPAQVASALTSNATSSVVKSPGTGSPNKLLYAGFIGGGSTGTAPVASFSASCTNLACNFDASGSTALSGATYAWAFGDGSSASGTSKTASHTYASANTYTIVLTVTDANGTGTDQKSVTVSAPSTPAPVARFTYACSARSCTFNAGTSSNATSFAWSFGDGGTGTGATATHAYSANGNLTVTLTATGSGGSDTAAGSVKCVKNACTSSGSGS